MWSSCEQRMDVGAVSTAPGTLVWVRRRNGSWWPGLVMSPESQPPRKRKGMPVKLLGKENGSMDWYDIQKSKRIKAFRCGEYDECIEKAMKNLYCSTMSDRMGKYARRDDAIIHALEIENSRPDRFQELCSSSQIAVGSSKGHKTACQQFTAPQPTPWKATGGSSSHITAARTVTLKKRRWKRLSAPDDGEDKEIRRMRGLNDIGMGVRSIKSDYDMVDHKVNEKSLSDNVSTVEVENQNGVSCSHHETSSNNLGSPLKGGSPAARGNVSNRRKKRRRPMSKLLASSEIVAPQFYSERDPQNDLVVLDSSESKKTDISVVINSSSDCSDNSCEKTLETKADGCDPLDYDKHLLCHRIHGDPSTDSRFDAGCDDKIFDIPVAVEENCSVEKQHAYSSNSIQILPMKETRTSQASDERKNKESTSGSHLKTNTCMSNIEVGICDYATDIVNESELYLPNDLHGNGLFTSSKGNSHRRTCDQPSKASMGTSQDVGRGMVSSNLFGNEPLDQISGACDTCNGDPFLRSRKRVTSSSTHTDLPDNLSISSRKRTKQSSLERVILGTQLHCNTQIKGWKVLNMQIKSCSMPNLYNVNIDVQASHKGPRAPLVSLTSKLNGKAIVGHSVAVDSLIGSSMNDFLTGSDRLGNVVRCPAVSKEKKITSCTKQANFDQVPSKVKVISKTRKSRLMSKKMRKLSTISAGSEKVVEKAMGTVVSCVPLKLVFSRINEDLGKHL